MPRKVSELGKSRKPDFVELATEILARIERRSGELLVYAGYELSSEMRTLFAEREELVGILAHAAFARIHLSSPFTDICRDLRAIKRSPRKYSSNKESYSAEARALLDRHLLYQGKYKNTEKVFEIEKRENRSRSMPPGNIGKAAAAALAELEAAYRRCETGEGSVDPWILPFVELPISQSNTEFARSLRRWLTKEGTKPRRITQHNVTHSSVDSFLEIVLPIINEMITAFGGSAYSQTSLVKEMSVTPQQK